MSRLGKQPVTIPTGVTVTCDGGLLTVTGPKGTLTKSIRPDVNFTIEGNILTLTPNKTDNAPALWGTYAAHARNMIKGVTEGFVKILDIEGVGYRAEVKGSEIVLSMGYSHLVPLTIPAGISVLVEKTVVTISVFDKDAVGQFASDLRKVRKP